GGGGGGKPDGVLVRGGAAFAVLCDDLDRNDGVRATSVPDPIAEDDPRDRLPGSLIGARDRERVPVATLPAVS
ncbi:MAG: hypothetical protein AAF745_11885, partial [Planctomycetota bacterium]